MILNNSKKIIFFICILCLFLFFTSVFPCNVPVFRYALERWQADCYEVFIFHKGRMNPESESIVNWLKLSSVSEIPYSNYKVNIIDLDNKLEGPLKDIWESLDSPKLPCMVVINPSSLYIGGNVWSVPLTEETARALIQSPVRQEIAKRIIDGETAVWILLESGDREKDNAAADMLQTQLDKLENSLELPVIQNDYSFNDFVAVNENGPELRIDFSIIRLSRTESAESQFIEMLMNSEPGLFEYASLPMVFPVLGRGRALYSLIGDGINERNIHRACEFIIGPCSCIIKAQNPGVDILMLMDWDAGIRQRWVEDVELPPLTGLSELAHIAAADEASEDFTKQPEIDAPRGHLLRNILLILGIVVMITIILSLRYLRSTNDDLRMRK